jgi:hypothetical protein
MARILSDETSLTRKRAALQRENRVLRILAPAEGVAGVLLGLSRLIPGLTRMSALAPAGILFLLLALGHFVKMRQNRDEERSLAHGLRGEAEVTRILSSALGNDTYVFNDLTLRHGRRTSQIDHLVLSPNGLFVLETKNWRGVITGDETQPRWSQARNPGERPVSVSNPVIQNRRHVETLCAWLKARGIPGLPVHSLILSTRPAAVFRVDHQTVPILAPSQAAQYITDCRLDRPLTESDLDPVLHGLMKAGA